MSSLTAFSKKTKWLGLGFFALIMLMIVGGFGACKQSNEVPPQTVTFTISVYDHMKAGPQRTLTKEGLTNSTMQVYFSEVAIGEVSQLYMAAREPNIGKLLGKTNSGVLSIATNDSTNIDVYLFSGGLDTYLAQVYNQGPTLVNGREGNWFRKNFDGRTPNNEYQSNFETVFADINNALWAPFKVGSCSPQGGTVWSYGCKALGASGSKDYGAHWVAVDDLNLHSEAFAIQRTMMSEVWEGLARIDNIGGGPSQMLICNGDRLNAIGGNLIRAAYLLAE